MNTLDKIMQYLAPFVMVAAAVLIIAFLIDSTKQINKDNNVYVRYIACALSVDPAKRHEETIGKCWDHVIEETGHEVHRYDEINFPAHTWLREE